MSVINELLCVNAGHCGTSHPHFYPPTSLFAALDVASGFVIGQCHKRHRAKAFLDFLKQIDANAPCDLDIHVVMDNYATHETPRIKNWLARRPRHLVHVTPTSASWIKGRNTP